MGAVIAMLLQAEKEDLITWIIDELSVVLAARTEIVLPTDGAEATNVGSDGEESDDEDERGPRKFGGPSKAALEKFAVFYLDHGDDEDKKNAMAKDAQFRLMLKLLSFEHSDDEKGACGGVGKDHRILTFSVRPKVVHPDLSRTKQPHRFYRSPQAIPPLSTRPTGPQRAPSTQACPSSTPRPTLRLRRGREAQTPSAACQSCRNPDLQIRRVHRRLRR